MTVLEVIDFSGAWDSLWAKASTAYTPEMQRAAMWIGVLLVLWAAWQWVWGKHKGKGTSSLLWVLIIGTALVAPTVVIPVVTNLLDMFLNFVISIVPSGHPSSTPTTAG